MLTCTSSQSEQEKVLSNVYSGCHLNVISSGLGLTLDTGLAAYFSFMSSVDCG